MTQPFLSEGKAFSVVMRCQHLLGLPHPTSNTVLLFPGEASWWNPVLPLITTLFFVIPQADALYIRVCFHIAGVNLFASFPDREELFQRDEAIPSSSPPPTKKPDHAL